MVVLFHSTAASIIINMFRPPVRRIFVHGGIKQQRIPNSLLSFLALYEMIFGFKFGCIKVVNCNFKMAAQGFSIAMGFFMISTLSLTFMVAPDEGNVQYWRHISFFQYIPAFCILLSMKYTVCEVLVDLGTRENSKIGLIAWLYTSLMFVLKMIGAMMYCALTECDRFRMAVQFCMHTPMLALDVLPIVNSLIFYLIYVRMWDLKRKLERGEITLEQLELDYKAVANCIDKFRAGYDAMFIWGFLTDSPKLMFLVWSYLHSMKKYKSWILKFVTYVYAMHATLQICIPAVFAEMVAAQTDRIKMILHDRLLAEKEEPSPCGRLIRYLKARPLLGLAWRLLPLDLRLPTAMLSMCATYVIVIVQFTHLYD